MLKRLFTLAALWMLPFLLVSGANAQPLPALVLTNFGQFAARPQTSLTLNDAGANSSYSMVAGGLDLWGRQDNGTFGFFEESGDFDVRVRVESLEAVHRYAKSGIMVRESLSSAARMVSIFATPTGPTDLPPEEPTGEDEVEFNFRRAAIEGEGQNNINLGSPGFPNAWLRLARRGSVVYGMVSRDGVNWTKSASVNTATWPGGALKPNVLLGLGSSSHDATRLVRSELRDFSNVTTVGAVQIATQPASTAGVVGSTVTFPVSLNDPVDAQYQWRVDGAAITGATNATFTTPTLDDASHNKRYSVVVTGSNGTPVTSADAVLSIVAIAPPESPAIVYDFDDGEVPFDGVVYGTASVSPTGGVGGSGGLILTAAANNQNGSFVIGDFNGGAVVDSFTAAFKLKIGPGSAKPADGFSFNFGPSIPNSVFQAPQQGVGPGLAVSFDIYDNGEAEGPAIDVFYGVDPANSANLKGNILHHPMPLSELVTSRYVDVVIQMHPDGKLDLLYNGKVIAHQVQTGFVPTAFGKFGFGAYAGGQNAFHGVDDIQIGTTYLSDEAYVSSVAPLGNNVSATPQIQFRLTDQSTQVDASSIRLDLDGTPITSPRVEVDPNTLDTVVTHNVTTLLPALTEHTVTLRWSDNAGTTRTNTSTFRVGNYGSLPAPVAGVGSGKSGDEGFKVRVYQIAQPLTPTSAFAESVLAGERGANIADTVVADDQGFFTDPLYTSVIDYDVNAAPSGFSTFPGIPGTSDSEEHFAVEVLTYLEFPQAGFYQMAVRSDDGFVLTAGEESNTITVGAFEGEREPSDTLVGFVAPAAGVYPFRMLYYQAAGGGSIRWQSIADNGARELINAPDSETSINAYRSINGGTAPRARLTITRNGANLMVGWTGSGTLESTTDLNGGSWEPVLNATNPMSVSTNDRMRFFRVRQ